MKNLKTIFGMAVLAIVTAACNNNDDFLAQQPQLPEEPAVVEQGIPFSATINSGEGTSMRAVAVDGDNISSTFDEGEHVALIYQVGSENVRTDANVTSVDGSGNATIEAELDAGVTDGTAVTLIYPSNVADGITGNILTDVITYQDGTLSEERDIRKGTGTIKVDGTATVDGSITLDAQYAICKFTVKNLANDALAVTSLKVSDAAGNEITTVTPSPAASVLYVTLPASTGVTWFEATGSDSKKYVTKGTAALTAGKFYTPTMKMATLGDLMGANGKFYANAAGISAASTTAVGVIAYLGNDNFTEAIANGGGHGLVLCLKNAASNVKWSTETVLKFPGQEVTNADGLKRTENVSGYTNTATLTVDAATTAKYPAAAEAKGYTGLTAPASTTGWFLPSAQQWVRMMTGLGGLSEGDITWINWFNNDHSGATAWETAMAKAGEKGTAYESMTDANLNYWSSSEYSLGLAVNLYVDATNASHGFYCNISNKNNSGDNSRVRPVLAF